jgi:hypothetical protein
MILALFDRFPNQNLHCLPKDKLYAPDTDSRSFCSSRAQHGNAAKNSTWEYRDILVHHFSYQSSPGMPQLHLSVTPASVCYNCIGKMHVSTSQAKLDNATFCEKVLFAFRQKLHLEG